MHEGRSAASAAPSWSFGGTAEGRQMMAMAMPGADIVPAPRPVFGGGSLRALAARRAAENGVPFALANAVIMIESRYHPHVANHGALGLMQIKAQTARSVGFAGSPRALLNPDTNLRFGMRYLAIAWRASHGSICATVMRYQSGVAATHLSAANRAYCRRAMQLMHRR